MRSYSVHSDIRGSSFAHQSVIWITPAPGWMFTGQESHLSSAHPWGGSWPAFRTSLERAGHDFQPGASSVTYSNRNDLKAAWAIGQPVPRQVVGGQGAESCAFPPGDGLLRCAEPARSSSLDLDEHDGLTVSCHDVDFAAAGTVAARNNCVPATPQFATGQIFTGLSEEHALATRHGTWQPSKEAAKERLPASSGHRREALVEDRQHDVGFGPGHDQGRRDADRVVAGAKRDEAT